MLFAKLLASAHGIFGVFIFVILWAGISGGLFEEIGTARTALKVTGSIVGGVFLLLTAWAAWQNPGWSAPFALAALAVFVATAAGDEMYNEGLRGLTRLVPTFYIAVVVRAVAAIGLGTLINRAV